jgi:hypothetical protein
MRAPALIVATVLMAATAAAQYGVPRLLARREPLASDPSGRLPDYDGGFRFCRVWFRNGAAGDGDGWYVDYPRADENLSIRLMELTKTRVTQDGEGNPYPVVVRLTDPSLFHCPFLMMSEPGGSYFNNEEAANLRAYLLKGGFLVGRRLLGQPRVAELGEPDWQGALARRVPDRRSERRPHDVPHAVSRPHPAADSERRTVAV